MKEGRVHKEPPKNMRLFIKYLNKGDKVLDAGCGFGRDSFFLAKHGFEVWGVDISSKAIKRAKRNFKARNLHFSVGDIQNLDFKDNFFDAVYSGGVLHMLPLEKPASEIYRVLKDGGIAFLHFLLNKKYISGETTSFHKKEDIIKVYRKKFKILKQIQFHQEDLEAEKPHTHDVLILILKKNTNTFFRNKIHFERNRKLEELILKCFGERNIQVYEGKFPWVRKTLFGYKIFINGRWRRAGTAVRGGFFSRNRIFLHTKLPLEEKIGIIAHELVHIMEGHKKGNEVWIERPTTVKAIKLIKKHKECLKEEKINYKKCIKYLKRRLRLYSKKHFQ